MLLATSVCVWRDKKWRIWSEPSVAPPYRWRYSASERPKLASSLSGSSWMEFGVEVVRLLLFHKELKTNKHTGYIPLLNSWRECAIIYTYLVTPCVCHLTTAQCIPRVQQSSTGFTFGNKQFSFKVMIQYFERSTLIFPRSGASRR